MRVRAQRCWTERFGDRRLLSLQLQRGTVTGRLLQDDTVELHVLFLSGHGRLTRLNELRG